MRKYKGAEKVEWPIKSGQGEEDPTSGERAVNRFPSL